MEQDQLGNGAEALDAPHEHSTNDLSLEDEVKTSPELQTNNHESKSELDPAEEDPLSDKPSFGDDIPQFFSQKDQMCPTNEIQFRIKNELVHKFEQLDNEPCPKLMVKEYRRSAADMVDMNDETTLRSQKGLQATIDHLLADIMRRSELFTLKFDFIDDRLRAVRQELTIQRLTLTWFGCKQLLACVKFYLISRRLFYDSKEDKNKSDRVHDCEKRLYECIASISEFIKTVEADELFGREIQTSREALSAIILTRMNDLKPSGLIYSTIFHRLGELLSNGVCLLPIDLIKAYLTKNWCRFARIFHRLSRIQQISVEPHILTLRKICLDSCAVAYHNQQLPLRLLANWLLMPVGDARKLLEETPGVNINSEDVILNRKEFTTPSDNLLDSRAAGALSFEVLAHMVKGKPEVAGEVLTLPPIDRAEPRAQLEDNQKHILSTNPLDNIGSDDDDTPIWMKSSKNNRRQRRRDSEKKDRRNLSEKEQPPANDQWIETKCSKNNRQGNRNRGRKEGQPSGRGRKPGSTASRSWQHDDRTRTSY